MSIACLGWGSLIWEPRALARNGVAAGLVADGGSWRADGPRLPVELARESEIEGQRFVSWVITPGVESSQTLWTTLDLDERAAVRVLAEREGVSVSEIGTWPGALTSDVDDAIATWARANDIARVIWTASAPQWRGERRAPAELELIEFLDGLVREGAAGHAETYVRNTPPQIASSYRRAIARRFGWT